MINNLKKSFAFLTLFFSIFVMNISVFGADPIYVRINNVAIVYTDAQPQIMNQRAMVPIRQTAERLGATLDWNKETETMTLHKGSRTVVHTMRSNIITVDGKAVTFDTPSAVVSDRTMMPVRMLSESLGNIVNWDNATRTVNITATEAGIISVEPDKTSINSGETINIAITASAMTDKIKILDVSDNNKIIAEANTYVTNQNETKLFSIPWTPRVDKSIIKTLKVVPGTISGYNEKDDAYKAFVLDINASTIPKITSFKVDKENVARNEDVKITIETNSATDSIKIGTKDEPNIIQVSNYLLKTEDSTTRVFEATITMKDRGEVELRAYAGKDNQYGDDYETKIINVDGAGSTNEEKNLTIYDTYVLNNDVYVGEDVKVVIKTSTDIAKIEVQNDNDRVVESTRYPVGKNRTNYIWELDIPVDDNGRTRFNFVAYDSDDYKVKDSITLNAYTYQRGDLHILNVEQRDIGAKEGDNVEFIVRTTDLAKEIKIMDGNKEILKETRYTSRGSIREWKVNIKITEDNKNSLEVVAVDDSSRENTRKIAVYIGTQELGEIYDYELITPKVYKNDYIRVTVYTNKTVERVWIEDSNDVSVVRETNYDDMSGNEYTWNLRFPAEEIGSNVRYTIYVEDENGKINDETFRVNVEK